MAATHNTPMSLRELARQTGISTRTLGRLNLPRTADKQYAGMTVLATLIRRFQLAETLCNKWCPGELKSRWAELEHRR